MPKRVPVKTSKDGKSAHFRTVPDKTPPAIKMDLSNLGLVEQHVVETKAAQMEKLSLAQAEVLQAKRDLFLETKGSRWNARRKYRKAQKAYIQTIDASDMVDLNELPPMPY